MHSRLSGFEIYSRVSDLARFPLASPRWSGSGMIWASKVIDNTVKWMRAGPPGQQTIWRAKFSAISATEIKAAMVGLREMAGKNANRVLAFRAYAAMIGRSPVFLVNEEEEEFASEKGCLDNAQKLVLKKGCVISTGALC